VTGRVSRQRGKGRRVKTPSDLSVDTIRNGPQGAVRRLWMTTRDALFGFNITIR
jgi:hypothetical protein